MRFFANIYLFLFLADGVLSFVDELFGPGGLTEFRVFWASVVFMLGFPLYLFLGLDRRLPKRVFLPQLLFLFLLPPLAWAWSEPAQAGSLGLGAAAMQVLLGLLPLALRDERGGRSLALPEERFSGAGFSWRNTLVFGAVSLFVVPAVLGLLGIAGIASFIQSHTAGYVRLAPEGLYMAERVFTRDGKTVRLAGMVHVGAREYYEDLSRSLEPGGRTLVLAEGVADAQGLLRNRFSYDRVAKELGLESQQKLRFDVREVRAEDFQTPGFVPGASGVPDLLRADVDLKNFHPITLAFLNEMGRQMAGGDSLMAVFLGINAWAEENLNPEANRQLMDDILHTRNRELIAHIDPALALYELLVIPWGALHMPAVEQAVLGKGFALARSSERLSIDFRKLPVERLLRERKKEEQ